MKKKKDTIPLKILDITTQLEKSGANIQALIEQFQNWVDTMPDNLQESSRAERIREAIELLEEKHNDIDSAIHDIMYCWED